MIYLEQLHIDVNSSLLRQTRFKVANETGAVTVAVVTAGVSAEHIPAAAFVDVAITAHQEAGD